MLPDYMIHEQLEQLRRENYREKRLQIEQPMRMPLEERPDHIRWNDYDHLEQEKIERGEVVIRM